MKKIKLITDSGCDLNKEIIKKYNIGVVPLNVSIDDKTYVDGELSCEEFYYMMKNSKNLPKTSCPSPDAFLKHFDCEEENILVITLASNLSAINSVANIAKNTYNEEENSKNIHIIDSETGSAGLGILLYRACKLIEEGVEFSDLTQKIEEIKKEIVCYGALDTLENAIKGGRVNKVAGKIIDALNLKPIVNISEGKVKPVDKARGESNSLKKVADNILSKIDDNKKEKILFVTHANCIDKANKMVEIMKKRCDFSDIVINEIGSVIGTHSSYGAVIVAVN